MPNPFATLGRIRAYFFKSHIPTYAKKDGTVVPAHDDKRHKRGVVGHKRLENTEGTDLFSAPAPVADKVKNIPLHTTHKR